MAVEIVVACTDELYDEQRLVMADQTESRISVIDVKFLQISTCRLPRTSVQL